jgi:tetratricopeptide (TPR) repeat protein
VWAALAGAAMMSAATLAVSLATAQSQPQIDWCVNVAHGFSLDQQISGCTVAIQSRRWRGQELAWAFNNRGFAYYRKAYLDPAFGDFEQAIRLDPKDAVAFNNRGLIYQAKGDLDRAIADYNETIRLDPTYIFAFNNRGGAYQDKNDYDRAIADYSEAIRLNPEYVLYQIPENVTLRRFPNHRGSDSRRRTMEVRHGSIASERFRRGASAGGGEEDQGWTSGSAPAGTCCDL